jgi:hypothetical protein
MRASRASKLTGRDPAAGAGDAGLAGVSSGADANDVDGSADDGPAAPILTPSDQPCTESVEYGCGVASLSS